MVAELFGKNKIRNNKIKLSCSKELLGLPYSKDFFRSKHVHLFISSLIYEIIDLINID